MSDQKAKPKIKRKSFSYLNEIEWEEPRVGSLRADEKPEIRFSSPPEFKGEAGNWTPEDFFVAAINTCTMTTFGAFSSKLDLPVRSYSSSAEGLLEFADGGYQFTRVTVRPVIRVASQDAVERAEKTIHDAHQKCLITNSIKGEVILEPTIEVDGD